MSFNCPEFIKEFRQYVKNLQVGSILEVGCYSGELKKAVGADGIDISPRLPDVVKCDVRDYKTDKLYDLVFSSGLLGHYSGSEAVDILRAMAKLSSRYVLTYVPNSGCIAYINYKKKTNAKWKDEDDYTQKTLASVHRKAGLKVLETGIAAKQWAKRFGKEPSEGYLVYCLAEKKSKSRKKEISPADNVPDEWIGNDLHL